jgi:hypothetical protein
MLMHACHECGEPWAIWLCGVILPLLFLAGCVGFLWFESGHQTRCPIESIGPQPHCLMAHGLRSAARIAAAVRRSVCRLMPTGSMSCGRDSMCAMLLVHTVMPPQLIQHARIRWRTRRLLRFPQLLGDHPGDDIAASAPAPRPISSLARVPAKPSAAQHSTAKRRGGESARRRFCAIGCAGALAAERIGADDRAVRAHQH